MKHVETNFSAAPWLAQSQSLALALLLALPLVTACGEDQPKPPAAESSGDATADDDAGEGGLDDAVDDEFGGDDDGLGGGDDDGLGGDDDGGADDGVVEEGETGKLEEILSECGGLDYDDTAALVVDQGLKGLPAVKKGTQPVLGFPVAYAITITPDLSIKSTVVQTISTTSIGVVAEPKLAQATADKEAARSSGPTTTDFMPIDQRETLVTRDGAWDGLLCTVQPGLKVTAALGVGTTVVTFDPPLPASVSPKADPARYAAEIDKARTFSGIKATVVSSTNPAVAAGATYTGTVTLKPVDATATIQQGDGKTVTVGGDAAFQIAIDFGGADTTRALGLKPSTTFYLDHETRLYKAIVVDLGDPATPPAVLIAPSAP